MIFPNKSAYTAGQPFVVRALSVLTGSYVAGTVASFDEHNAVGIELTYVKGDETSMQMKLESSIDNGTTYTQQVTQSATGGTVTITPAEYTFVAASQPATALLTILVSPIKGDHLRLSFKATGGTPTGTVTARLLFGWV